MGHRGSGLQDWGGVYPYPFGDDAFRAGEYSYESFLLLSLCEVVVDVVEDVGRVRVQVSAREGLRLVLCRVASLVQWIVGVFVFARFAWFVHAVADGDPSGVGAGPRRCRGEQPLGVRVLGPMLRWGWCWCGGTSGPPVHRLAVASGLWGACGGVL